MKDVLSTRELAEAIGVSESSIKRWADEGVLNVSRTAGGHRRIAVHEAIRFVRETGTFVVRPELFGLSDAAELAESGPLDGDDTQRLIQYLKAGAAPQARGLIQSLYLAGHSVASIVDGPLRAAMHHIGDLWRHEPEGVFREHRATDICLQALNQLRLMFPEREGAPVATGGALSGDPYVLPSLAAATVLAAEGFRAVNLGADTPFETFDLAVAELDPALVWISVSGATLRERTASEIQRFADRVRPLGVSVVVGGRTLPEGPLPASPNLHHGRSMAELAAFARGLAAAAPSEARS